MNNITIMEFNNQRIMTTKVLAEGYNTKEDNINKNFQRNSSRFIEGKHYYQLTGESLKEFKNSLPTESLEPIKFAPVLYLWTEKGAARHAKILETDEAWEVYEQLEETYFRVRENKLPQLSKELQAIFVLDQRTEKIIERMDKFENESPLFNIECDELQKLVRKIGVKLLGGKDAPAYKNNSLRQRVYSDIQKQLNREFGTSSYKAIKRVQLDKSKIIIESYKLPLVLENEISVYNNQLTMKVGE